MTSLILAAGASSRLGQPKQLVHFQGKTLIAHTIEVALAVSDHVTVVLGANHEQILPFISHYPIQILQNQQWAEGMASSIRLGVAQVHTSLLMLLLCDQPFVSATLLQTMLNTQQATQSPIVTCEYAGTKGVPMLFDESIFPELLALKGDKGARAFLHKYPQAVSVPFEQGAIDIDTLDDVEALKRRLL